MDQTDWRAKQRLLVEWLTDSNVPLVQVKGLESGGLYEVEAAWMQAMEALELETLDEALTELREPLLQGDLYRASRVALFCGSFVERGADPTLLTDAMVSMLEERLVQALQLVVEVEDGEDCDSPDELTQERLEYFWENYPEWVKGWHSLEFIVLPTMTMLARDLEARKRARLNSALMDLVDAMEEVHDVVYYISQLLCMADDEEVVVLHRAENKGFRVRLEAIRNNFHLFTLLQDALLNSMGGPLLLSEPPDPVIGSIARGESALEEADLSVDAIWGYFQWTFRAGVGSHEPDNSEGVMSHLIWGEMLPETILKSQEGVRVILLEPVPFARSWSVDYFAPLHDALRSSVEVLEILSPADVDEWFRSLETQSLEENEDSNTIYH